MQHTAKKCGSLRIVLDIDFFDPDKLLQAVHKITEEATRLDSSAQCSAKFVMRFTGDLPPVADSTDAKILEWVIKNPDLTDSQIGQRLGISRQAVNERRRKLQAMGYSVR